MQQLHSIQAPEETRYDAETVRQAAVLATRLQQHQQETLSLEQVDALSAELGIDRDCMRRALTIVEKSGRQEHARGKVTGSKRLGVAAAAGATLMVLILGVQGVRSGPGAPPAATLVTPISTPVPEASVVRNGGFEQRRASAAGTPRDVSHWTLSGAETRWHPTAFEGGRSLYLGKQGSIKQTFRTMPGWRYRISFRLKGLAGQDAAVHHVRVHMADTWANLTCFTEARGDGVAPWEEQSVEITAQEPGSTLTIETTPDLGPGGVLIDQVQVQPAS